MCSARRAFTAILVTLTVAALAGQQTQTPELPGGARGGAGRGVGGGGGRGGGRGQVQRPPRDDRAQTEAIGSARIRGRVAAADTGVAVRRAQVRLTSPEIRVAKVALTDSQGAFEFTQLPAGGYTLSVTRTGYVTWQFGQRRPLEPGKRIDLETGQTMDGVNVALPRGSVISGRIFDEFGEPVPDATVQAMRYQYVGGQRQLAPAGRVAQTDDIGQFRVFGLMPGDYYITATLRTPGLPVQLALDIQGLAQGPFAAGRGGIPPAIAEQLQAFAGPQPEESTGYAPTYYPGTPNVAEAQRITVGVGEEVPGIGFALTAVRLSRISGTVVDSQGAPLTRAQVMLRPSGAAGFMAGPGVRLSIAGAGGAWSTALAGNAAAPVSVGGIFTLNGVTPGDYVLQVRAPGAGGEPEFASVPINVNGSDIDGLVLVTSKGATVTGRVTFGRDGAGTSPKSLQINAISLEADLLPIGPAAQRGRVDATGEFQLRGLNGATLFRLGDAPAGWTLKAVRLGGTEVTDTPYVFKGGETLDGLEIELTNKLTQIDGTVTDARGQPVGDHAVVVFADVPQRWGFQTRFVQATRSGQDGRFQITGLPPGRYLAVALEYLEQGSQSDPELLARLKPIGTSVTLDEGGTQQLNLKLSQ